MKAAAKRRMAVVLACGVLVSAARAGAQAPAADELAEKYLAAIGGRAALEKLQSRVATGTISMSVQGAALAGPAEIFAKAPNKSRTHFIFDLKPLGAEGQVVVDQRCDGKTAWVHNSAQGDRVITGSQLQALVNSEFPSPLLGYKAAGATLELVGSDTLAGRPVHVLRFTPKAGPASRLYLDAESFLLVRLAIKLDIPELGGEVEQRTDFEDYRVVDAVKVPFSAKIANGVQEFTITLTKVEHNTAIDEALFGKPAGKE